MNISPEERTSYELVYERKLKEIYTQAYPICLNECTQSHPEHDDRMVFTHDRLLCATNCLSKYKVSLNLALGLQN